MDRLINHNLLQKLQRGWKQKKLLPGFHRLLLHRARRTVHAVLVGELARLARENESWLPEHSTSAKNFRLLHHV